MLVSVLACVINRKELNSTAGVPYRQHESLAVKYMRFCCICLMGHFVQQMLHRTQLHRNPRHSLIADMPAVPLLQIASCSMHHSGALLLEARDGEFLDEQLCCSNIAASTHLQQPDQQVRPMPEDASHDAMDTGIDEGYDGAEGCSHDFDDCGGGDDGADYMQQEAANLDHAGVPGQQASWQQSMPFWRPPRGHENAAQ